MINLFEVCIYIYINQKTACRRLLILVQQTSIFNGLIPNISALSTNRRLKE